jgi:Tol biopolymer transport system component
MQVLVFLARRAGETVSREEILDHVWEGTVVAEEALTSAIRKLRKALGDDAKDPTYIQTVPGRGYRLNVEVSWQSAETHQTARLALLAAGALLIVLLAFAVYRWATGTTEPIIPRTQPLTSLPGLEYDPAISPDGTRVAFAWNEGEGLESNLYVKLIGVNEPTRLTEGSRLDFSPAWSPDGTYIAFLRERRHGRRGESEVLITPASGGAVRLVATIATGLQQGVGWSPGLSWSPDGKLLATTDRDVENDRSFITLISVENGSKRRIASAEKRNYKEPSFSPDGKAIAFARHGFTESAIFLLSLDELEPELVAAVEGAVLDIDWLPEGSGLVYTREHEKSGRMDMWKIDFPSRRSTILSFGENAFSVSSATNAPKLVYARHEYHKTDIWRLEGPTSPKRQPPIRWSTSSRPDWDPEISMDGTKVAFTSMRSGSNNIWMCDVDGSSCTQLTDLERASFPRWSPDGREVVFACAFEGNTDVCVVEVESLFVHRLTEETSADAPGFYSSDGRSIFFASNRSGNAQVWKMPARGGSPIQITTNGGLDPRVTHDGRFIYYPRGRSDRTIYRMDIDGDEEEPILVHEYPTLNWTLWRDQIVVLYDRPGDEPTTLDLFDIESQSFETLESFPPETMVDHVAVSFDGRWIYITSEEPRTSDIYLVEGVI